MRLSEWQVKRGILNMDALTRRSFLAAAGTLAALPVRVPVTSDQRTAQLTAADVIQRIKDHIGVPWRTETVDRIIAGAPQTSVKGIATTMMSTMDVVQRAAIADRNMIITHEPTMKYCADWLEGFVAEVPIDFVPAPEPFWRP